MEQRNWYILAYDIREPKRLRRVHAYIKKKGVALQKSVFLLRADTAGLEDIRQGIRSRACDRKDDVRIYPISHPGALWAAGAQSNAVSGMYAPVPDTAPSPGRKLARLLFGKKS